MTYTPKTWVNRQVERPSTYNLQNNTDGSVTLIPAEGVVIEEGTPLEASGINHLENGLAEVSTTVGNGINDYVRQPAFANTSGTSIAYTVSLSPAPDAILDGFGITIIPHVTNGTNATLNINGLGAFPLKKQNGQNYPAGRIIAGKPYSFRKVGLDFLADSAGGNGDALPAHVLAPYKFTNDDDEYIGTMVTITSGEDPALGVGQWPNGDLAVYPREGYRKGGSGAGEIRVTTAQLQSADAEFRADRILENNNIFGVNGSIPNNSNRDHHMPGRQYTVWSGDRFFIQPPRGFYTGDSWVTAPAPNLKPENILKDVNVNGIVGTSRPYYGGAYSANFKTRGLESGQQIDVAVIPAAVTHWSLAGLVEVYISMQDWFLMDCRLLAIDVHGNEIRLTGGGYIGTNITYYTTSGLFVDKPNRTFTTVYNGSGPDERNGGWNGETDIGVNGTFTKPFNMNDTIRIVYRVNRTVGPGYNGITFQGKVAYN